MLKTTIASLIVGTSLISMPVAAKPTQSDVECLAKVIYHEAGNQPVQGQRAVGYVILNRSHNLNHLWGKGICGVVHQKGQFDGISRAKFPKTVQNYYLTLASDVIREYSVNTDPTHNAFFFHNTHSHPNWKYVKRTVKIANHIFYTYKK